MPRSSAKDYRAESGFGTSKGAELARNPSSGFQVDAKSWGELAVLIWKIDCVGQSTLHSQFREEDPVPLLRED
jgi:hypothetical protein